MPKSGNDKFESGCLIVVSLCRTTFDTNEHRETSKIPLISSAYTIKDYVNKRINKNRSLNDIKNIKIKSYNQC